LINIDLLPVNHWLIKDLRFQKINTIPHATPLAPSQKLSHGASLGGKAKAAKAKNGALSPRRDSCLAGKHGR
jgi:hypothetical protein